MSKRDYIFAVCWLLISVFTGTTRGARLYADKDSDHLIPSKGYVDSAYEALLRRNLFLTSGNYARIVTLASAASMGESAISIYSKSGRSGESILITWSRAERNLWYAENGDDPAFPKKRIKIERRDAVFPKVLAETISAGVKRMLEGARPMTANGQIVVDPVNIEISVEGGATAVQRAVLTPDAVGKTTSSFRCVVRLLEAYCQTSSETTRSELARKIAMCAKSLVRNREP
jgi:hypothetical protein